MTIVVLALTSISSMAFGLYAGKKRERGLGWIKIITDFAVDSLKTISSAFRTLSSPFKKGSKCPDEHGEVVEPEVA